MTATQPGGVNLQTFLRSYPAYQGTRHLDRVRAEDFRRLDEQGLIYLDYTGSGLPSRSQLRAYQRAMGEEIWGNPHSASLPSRRSTEAIRHARQATLRFVNADPEEYSVIFTANATGALRLVGESFPFQPGARLALLRDNHNSVLGIREYARARGATTETIVLRPDLRAELSAVLDALNRTGTAPSLFAYPAQSNFSGVQHPLDWISEAHARGWRVLLDAAAYVAISDLDLSRHKPDFVPLSYYKIFGWPTGLGCLIAKNDALAQLRRPWFSGGTVVASSALGGWHASALPPDNFEDGTPDFLGALGVSIGLDYVQQTLDRESVRTRVRCLMKFLLDEMSTLRHSNGLPVCALYGPTETRGRGPTIAFNLLDMSGDIVDERMAEDRAVQHGIALRAGCFCNPGVGETIFELQPADLIRVGTMRVGLRTIDDYRRAIGLPTGGALRVSLGPVSSFEDILGFHRYLRSWRDHRTADHNLGTLADRERC
ncbi:aminotransferase class V-fold PLP-dependent enzyme [Streptomyces gardneri]|uniref:aminotransferase class V-fold PLP-dependent enzyme n=1 Tax=Nocardia sputi TaxID=2943705 RepID=UPI0018960F94|nr:aminotransferase class V-fold PLP-dependent enzyme [Nocardia sputi]MBF6169614.1 aminotransferase class V-fold PLP-dependent enzyme [Streptomyces gardneri]MBF6207967.1 aminotransferase class V-fold PLP-dependent enzyme [Streptomyces gardneri]